MCARGRTGDDCGDVRSVCVPADYQGSGPRDVVYNDMRAVSRGFWYHNVVGEDIISYIQYVMIDNK